MPLNSYSELVLDLQIDPTAPFKWFSFFWIRFNDDDTKEGERKRQIPVSRGGTRERERERERAVEKSIWRATSTTNNKNSAQRQSNLTKRNCYVDSSPLPLMRSCSRNKTVTVQISSPSFFLDVVPCEQNVLLPMTL